MIGLLLRLLLFVHVLGFELRIAAQVAAIVPDVTAAALVVVGLRLPARQALRWVLPLAIARAFLLPGGLLFQVWLLLIGFLFVRAMRRFVNHDLWQIQAVLGGIVAAILSLVSGALLGGGTDPLGRGPIAFLMTAAIVPGVLVCHTLLTRRDARERAELGLEGG